MPLKPPGDVVDPTLATRIKQRAFELGFALVGITQAEPPETLSHLEDWLDAGMHGEMAYMARRREAYANPQRVLPGVRSVIMVAANYRIDQDVESISPQHGRIAAYARNLRDYHDVLREKLQQLSELIHRAAPESRTRVVVDTAPLLERDYARKAGLGWFGKNTMLINRRAGSFLLLGGLLTDLALPSDSPHQTAHCGTCTRCLEICPTQAFTQPYVLDARRCIAYLTIELRHAPVPEDLREGVGDWLFGCDLCQEVCPWNNKSPVSTDPVWQLRPDLEEFNADAFLHMTEDEFQSHFAGTPLQRTGRAALARNAAIVLGNSGSPQAVPALARGLQDSDPLVRSASVWGLARIGGPAALAALKAQLDREADQTIAAEIRSHLFP